MLKDKIALMPGRVRISYRGCGEQQLADQRRFEARYGVRIVETRDAGFDANRLVLLEDVETGERASVNGFHPAWELYIYPQQVAS